MLEFQNSTIIIWNERRQFLLRGSHATEKLLQMKNCSCRSKPNA